MTTQFIYIVDIWGDTHIINVSQIKSITQAEETYVVEGNKTKRKCARVILNDQHLIRISNDTFDKITKYLRVSRSLTLI